MISKELMAASTKPLVLAILSIEESYGYQLIQKMNEVSDHQIVWQEGTLYPLLHKMEENGLIESKWKQESNGRKRKYYFVGKDGRTLLENELDNWKLIFKTLNSLLAEA